MEKLIALGPKGSYGHEAAQIAREGLKLGETELCFVSTNVSILQAAEAEKCFAVIPVENSSYGDVVDVLGYLAKQSASYSLRIIGQVELPVRHCLLARQEITHTGELEIVMSHPQALGQCSESIKRWGFKTEVATSTAAAAKFAAEHPELKIGAIASELAAHEYGLKVLERDVQTREDNATRFFILAPVAIPYPPRGEDKTVLIFKVSNKPAALFEALSPFALRNINMTAIHSIALGGWNYGFYAEFDGHAANPQVHEALHELGGKTLERWVLGSFPKKIA